MLLGSVTSDANLMVHDGACGACGTAVLVLQKAVEGCPTAASRWLVFNCLWAPSPLLPRANSSPEMTRPAELMVQEVLEEIMEGEDCCTTLTLKPP
ncbi:unnamed protein product [Gadus morhua 'NCC']